MGTRYRVLAVLLAAAAGLVPGAAYADLKLATLTVKGMVCQA